MELYAIKNLDTGKYIFNARGGAYKDKEYVYKKMKKLAKENEHTLFQLVIFKEV